MSLRLESNIADPDFLYERLVDIHADLGEGQSALVNKRLVDLLSGHVHDLLALREASAIADEADGNGVHARDVRLVLLLTNHIGDMSKIEAALLQARSSVVD